MGRIFGQFLLKASACVSPESVAVMRDLATMAGLITRRGEQLADATPELASKLLELAVDAGQALHLVRKAQPTSESCLVGPQRQLSNLDGLISFGQSGRDLLWAGHVARMAR